MQGSNVPLVTTVPYFSLAGPWPRGRYGLHQFPCHPNLIRARRWTFLYAATPVRSATSCSTSYLIAHQSEFLVDKIGGSVYILVTVDLMSAETELTHWRPGFRAHLPFLDRLIIRRFSDGKTTISSIHAHRTVGGHRDHCIADRAVATGTSKGTRLGKRRQVRKQCEADRHMR